jgi:hypothetical protein
VSGGSPLSIPYIIVNHLQERSFVCDALKILEAYARLLRAGFLSILQQEAFPEGIFCCNAEA